MPSCFFESGKRSCFLRADCFPAFWSGKRWCFPFRKADCRVAMALIKERQKGKNVMDYTIQDEIADMRNVLGSWENGFYRLVVRANCLGLRGEILPRCSVIDIINAYKRNLVHLLKGRKISQETKYAL